MFAVQKPELVVRVKEVSHLSYPRTFQGLVLRNVLGSLSIRNKLDQIPSVEGEKKNRIEITKDCPSSNNLECVSQQEHWENQSLRNMESLSRLIQLVKPCMAALQPQH